MVVTLKMGEPLSTLVGGSSAKVMLNGAHSVAEAFAEMDRQHPGFAAELQRGEYDLPYNIFVNDNLVRWEKVAQTRVKDGDKIYLFLAVSGG